VTGTGRGGVLGGDYRQTAWSWTQHLRGGGTTPWTAWTAPDVASPVPDGWEVPGAAQLELVRRLARAGSLSGPAFTRLADLVLSRSVPGRGLAQQPLRWTGPDAPTRVGAPPADPAEVPVGELLRVAVGTLVELLVAAPEQPAGSTAVRRRLLSRAPAFELAGAPVTASVVRRGLALAGHVEGGRTTRVVLLAAPLDAVLAEVWSARVQHGAAIRWRGFARRCAGRRELPPAADLPALARHWSARVGVGEVHVVVGADGPGAALTRVGGVLGVGDSARRSRPRLADPPVRDLAPAAVDVLRRVNAVLDVRVAEGRRPALRRSLARTLAGTVLPGERSGPGLTVPAQHRAWVRGHGERIVEELRSAGYPVHGRLDDIVPRFAGRATHPRREEALRLALQACLDRAEGAR